MFPVEIKEKVHRVGAVDWNIRDFHGHSTYKGTTYNAYLIMDDKITPWIPSRILSKTS